MADIHVLEGRIQDGDRATYRYVFHVPTNADAGLRAKAALDPAVSGFQSMLGENITPAELTSIQAGELVEHDDTINYHKNDPAAEYLQRLRDAWAAMALEVPGDFERAYQWYGNTYSAT